MCFLQFVMDVLYYAGDIEFLQKLWIYYTNYVHMKYKHVKSYAHYKQAFIKTIQNGFVTLCISEKNLSTKLCLLNIQQKAC